MKSEIRELIAKFQEREDARHAGRLAFLNKDGDVPYAYLESYDITRTSQALDAEGDLLELMAELSALVSDD
ncbi:hypothetical protein ABZY93_22245 [Streptomyces smyrnaeus]|uniref:hypothetical protein n=1 Tax=Streptomyces smyrnaeus TaxID=1387713 RepID=UPI0033B7E16F